MTKGRLTLQWHINEKCNLNCKHCYQDSYLHPGLEFVKLKEVVHSFINLLILFNKKYNSAFHKGHINITGGEPLLHKDFFPLLKYLSEQKKYFSFAILSNGTLIDKKTAADLKKLNPEFIQVSMEGDQSMHDQIRGNGNFEQVSKALKNLHQAGIKSYISFTACKENYKLFPKVVSTGIKLKASKVWADRYVPVQKSPDYPETLNKNEAKEFFAIMNKECKKIRFFSKTKIEMSRALMFLESGKKPYHCSAGTNLICITHDGSFFPCRRLPVACGNIFESELKDLYFNNSFMQQLRDDSIKPVKCKSCSWFVYCRGGAKCISYALENNAFIADPACPIAALY